LIISIFALITLLALDIHSPTSGQVLQPELTHLLSLLPHQPLLGHTLRTVA
jgi:hypothetical protein